MTSANAWNFWAARSFNNKSAAFGPAASRVATIAGAVGLVGNPAFVLSESVEIKAIKTPRIMGNQIKTTFEPIFKNWSIYCRTRIFIYACTLLYSSPTCGEGVDKKENPNLKIIRELQQLFTLNS